MGKHVRFSITPMGHASLNLFRPIGPISKPSPSRTMQGVYYRPNHHAPWEFLGKTKSVIGAEKRMRKRALAEKTGVFVYIEAQNMPQTVWDLRNLGKIRLLARRVCKSFLDHWKPIRRNGHRAWQKSPVGQTAFDFHGENRLFSNRSKGKG